VAAALGDHLHLLGRKEQQRVLTGLITSARNGISGSVLIRGEPGIGKTALMHDATSRATWVRLIRFAGFEAESSIPFSGLQRLIMPFASQLSVLPPHYLEALLRFDLRTSP
jgi:predicted ATPase